MLYDHMSWEMIFNLSSHHYIYITSMTSHFFSWHVFVQGARLLRLSTSQEELEHLGLRKATNLVPWKQWMPSSRGKNLQMASFSPVFSAKTDDTSKQGISMTEGFRFWANPKWRMNLILNPILQVVKDDDSADFNRQKVLSICFNGFQSFHPTWYYNWLNWRVITTSPT